LLELRNRLDSNINKKNYGDFISFEKNQCIGNLPKTKDQLLKTIKKGFGLWVKVFGLMQ
jgi:hypothetical protein